MDPVSSSYLLKAELWLFITILAYFMMNGAQIFETAVIIPRWSASPPASLQVFHGKFGLDFKWFWIIAHSIHEITFILAIIFCWQLADIRNWLLILFGIHMAVRVWTLVYFAPNIIAFQRMADLDGVPKTLPLKVKRWRQLNYVRVALFIAVSLALLPVLCQLNDLMIK